jgi:probable rRNA maturation factor
MPKIHIINRQKDLAITKEKREFLLSILYFVLASEKSSCEELSLFFISDTAMRKMHLEFFDDPSPTDCISFPIEAEGYLGDVFICPKTAIEYAAAHKKGIFSEVLLYAVHGVLHLLGYDDITPVERKRMRQKERRYIPKSIEEKY